MLHIPLAFPSSRYGDYSIESFFRDGIHYQKLVQNGIIKMVNTPEIVVDFEDFLGKAEGDVLINGLGMGMCNVHLLKKEKLKSLTVVELDKDLVDFIAPFFTSDKRCTIINADAYAYEPPGNMFYDFVWHDVWTHQSVRNLKDIEILKKKYSNKARWQGAWREDKCKAQAKREMLTF